MCQISFELPAGFGDDGLRVDDAESDKSARPAGLDPAEEHHPQMPGKEAANACLASWQHDMPEAESAYQPSGRVPASALVAMGIGAGLGVIAATAVAVGIGALTVVLLGGFAWLTKRVKLRGKLFALVFLGGCSVLLGGYAVLYGAVGFITARFTTGFGQRMGKLRSAAGAAIFSITAVAISLGLLHVAQQEFGQWCDPGNFLRDHRRDLGGDWVSWLVRGLEIAGATVAVTVASIQASKMVRAKKFCETCELFMEEVELPEVGLGGLRILTAAATAGEVEAVSYLFDDPPPGKEGKALLFHCPLCGEGYLETHAQFHASWTKDDGKTETKETSWMTGSTVLGENEVEMLRRFIGMERVEEA
jgi:hypothetical protein